MSKQINIGGRIHSTEVGNVTTGANEVLDDTKGKKQNVINADVDAELLRLDQSKQNNLTFDNTPTENSTNPVTSGGVYAANITLHELIEAILVLIPSAASALNQLADKAFVNSSVSTATATFRGTYNVVTDLELAYDATHEQIATKLGQVIATADNNDYAFVQVPVSATSTDIRRTERYKFNGTVWGYEYDLNTSGFTAVQWEAINSGITALLVSKLTNLPTAEVLATMFAAKQNVLTFDAAPTALSTNPVYSGGVYAAIKAITDLIPAEATTTNQLADKAYVLASILAATPAFKGQFTSLVDLQAVSSPKNGDIGIVRTKDSDGKDVFTFYQYLNNQWNVYFSLSYHPQTKPATTGTTGDYPYNGMGRVELPMNIQDVSGTDKNLLTQDMFYKGAVGARVPNTNTIFVIRYDYELAENITIPANCVLQFEGGSISGAYTITGNNTGINAGLVNIFASDITISGTWSIAEPHAEWFGVVIGTDCTDAINKTLASFYKVVLAANTTYTVNGTINLNGGRCLRLSNRTIIHRTSENIDPVVSITGFSNSLLGESKESEIKSDSFTPYGLISMCDYKDTIADGYCQMNKIDNIRISGYYPTALPTTNQSIGLRFKHTGSGTGGYHNSITNMWFYYFNVGLKMAGDTNANYLRDLTFAYCGSSNFNTDSAILLEEAEMTNNEVYAPSENQIINVFVTGTYNDTGGSCLCINGGIRYNTIIMSGENGSNGRGMIVIGTESNQENVQRNIFILNFVQVLANSNSNLLYKNNTIIEKEEISGNSIKALVFNTNEVVGIDKFISGNYKYDILKINKNAFCKESYLNLSQNLGACFKENKSYEIFAYKLNGGGSRGLVCIRYKFLTHESNGYLNSFVESDILISKETGGIYYYETPHINDIYICKPVVSDGYLHFIIKMRVWTGSLTRSVNGYLQIESFSANEQNANSAGYFRIPENGSIEEYSGTVELAYGANSGTTAERPTYPSNGMNFFDTTLNKPIWYKGSNVWVDATGSTV